MSLTTKIKGYIPNTITCLNLLSGAVACILSFQNPDTWNGSLSPTEWAFIAIGAAAVFDFLDGAMARALHAYSAIGKELDSLSDLVSFGLAPSLLMLNLMARNSSGDWIGWPLCALFIVVMGALRLAKFNVDDRQTTSFIGLPIPANALFWIGFIAWTSRHGVPSTAPLVIIIAIVSLLMVSRLPLISLKFKNLSWRENFRRYAVIAATAIFLITNGVPGLMWSIIFYILISVGGRRQQP